MKIFDSSEPSRDILVCIIFVKMINTKNYIAKAMKCSYMRWAFVLFPPASGSWLLQYDSR